MDPISTTLGIIGLGMQIFGGVSASKNAEQQAAVSSDEARQEQGINGLKQQQMELDARRQQVQQMRVAQQTAALATSRAANQNAQFGSGLQGGLAGITDQSLFNVSGINQAVELGRGINKFNTAISSDKMQMAALGGQAATDQGIASLGGAVIKAGPITGQLSKGFGNIGNNFFGGGSPSGYGVG